MVTMRVEADPIVTTIVKRAVAAFAPARIILFGSRARGDARDDSDYDVMFVVDPRGEDRRAAETRVREAFATREWAMDIVVSLVPDYLWRRTDIGTLEYMAEREGRIVYSRPGFEVVPRVREVRGDAPRSLAEWIDRARRDYRGLDTLARAREPLEDLVCFHAHQAAEKTLKAVLVRAGISPPYRHLLSLLLSLCPDALRTLGGVAEACATLDRVFPKTRYPDNPIPTLVEVDAAVAAARLIREAARITGVAV